MKFENLIWLDDRMLYQDLVFRLEHELNDDWDDVPHFRFFKEKVLIEQFSAFFSTKPNFNPENILELGIYDGGSAALWNELFSPQKLVAIDIENESLTDYFNTYLSVRGLQDKIKLYWQTDQQDAVKLQQIVKTEFDADIHMIIDDASHWYEPTLNSFQTLFPHVAPGGLYIIEDWSWSYWPEFCGKHGWWKDKTSLMKLVSLIIEAAGTSDYYIANVSIYQGFIAIERSQNPMDKDYPFILEDNILRR